MDTSIALARANILVNRVEFNRHLIWKESRAGDGYGANGALADRIYTPLSRSQ